MNKTFPKKYFAFGYEVQNSVKRISIFAYIRINIKKRMGYMSVLDYTNHYAYEIY